VDLSVSIRVPQRGTKKILSGGGVGGGGGLLDVAFFFVSCARELYWNRALMKHTKSAPLSIQGFFAPGDSAFPSFDARWQTRHFSLYMFHPRKI
jgi:hypothetical protein